MLNVTRHISIFRGLMSVLFVLTMGQNLGRAENSILVWSPMTSGTTNWIHDVWGTGPCDVFAVGYAGTILHYDGNAWSSMNSGTTTFLFGVWGFSSNDVFAVGSGGIFHYDGTAWSPMTCETSSPQLRAIWGSGPDNVFAVGDYGMDAKILHYDGSTWTRSPSFGSLSPLGSSLSTIHGVDSTHIYAAGGTTSLRYYGNSWLDWPYYGINETPPSINDLWAAASNDIFGVGPNGTIVHSTGSTWTAMTSGTTVSLNGIWGSGPNDVFAVGSTLQNNGKILHYDGSAWSAMSCGTITRLNSVWGSSGHDVFAVGTNGTILHYGLPLAVQPRNQKVKSSAGTASWTISRTGTDTLTWSAEIIDGGDWVTIASGATGTDTGTLQVNYLANPSYCPRTATLHLIVNGLSQYPLEITLKQDSLPIVKWSYMASGTPNSIVGIWGSDPCDIFAVGSGGKILHHDGAVWSTMTSGTTETLTDVWGADSSNVFAVGYNGIILHYNGTAWSPMAGGTAAFLYDLWGSLPCDVFAVGYNGTILHYNGTTWSPMTTGTGLSFYGVWGTGPSDVFAVGSGGKILHFNGIAWSSMTSGTTKSLYSVWGSGPNDVFAVGYAGTIMHYDGSVWSPMTSGTTNDLYRIMGTGPKDIFAIGANGTVLHYDGTAWSPVTSGTTLPLRSLWAADSEEVFAVGDYGLILHYGLPLALRPRSWDVNFLAGTANFDLIRLRNDLQSWAATVIKGGDWLTITSASEGTDSGTISVGFSTNLSGSPRTATVRLIANGAIEHPLECTIVQAGKPNPGDVNGDGLVDVADLSILAANYGRTTDATWFQGDFNTDGLIDVGDLGILAANYGNGSSDTASNFNADYAKAFGPMLAKGHTAAEDVVEDEVRDPGSDVCSGLGLPLVVGVLFMGLMIVKLKD